MKNVQFLLWFMAGFCLLMACEKEEENLLPETEIVQSDLKCDRGDSHHRPGMLFPKTVTLPFKADFLGNYVGMEPSSLCGKDSWLMITNEGGGKGTFLGSFTHHFEFCCDVVTGIYPGNYMKAYFVAANGDSLFVASAGQVIEGRAEGQPEFVTSYFRDPFVILGGTGRFYGATGKGTTDDFNSSLDAYSHHHWRGYITMVKGKR
jgi:hypothetical protein